MSEELPYWLAASFITKLNTKLILQLLEIFPDIKSLFGASAEALEAVGLSREAIALLKDPPWRQVEQALTWAKQEQHTLLPYTDSQYPRLLREIPDPPLILYVQGSTSVLSLPQIAMVGSRNPTPTGYKSAQQFAYDLAQEGLVITSGLALGIDAASHRGALAAQGQTIAVFGTGLLHIYPAAHKKLAQAIIESQGAVVSEFPLSAAPQRWHFPARNRIISGLSLGVFIVEAALKSGSMTTARHASEQGREVFAMPGSIYNPLAHGCHQLLRQGAKLVETLADILEELNITHTASAKRSILSPITGQEHQKVLNQIGFEATAIDQILRGSGLTTSRVSSILLTLELEGYIQVVPGGYIRAR